MDTLTMLQSRLEAIKVENTGYEARVKSNQLQMRDIETAIRVISQLTNDKSNEGLFKANENILGGLEDTPQPEINYTDTILEVIASAEERGVSSQEIKDDIKDFHGADVKDSTLSVIIQRHKAKGKISRVGKKWFLASFVPATDEQTKETPVLAAPEHINDFL